MQTIIILAVHGIPPRNFPRQELAEFFRLHSQVGKERISSDADKNLYVILEDKLRNWPRTEENDPFHAASQELATQLSEVSGYEVIVGYNEFCAPSLDEALQSAVNKNANKIIVATPMMTRGGEHAEKDIPAKIKDFTKRYPKLKIIYAWPFDTVRVAEFLSEQISRFV